MTGRPWIGRIDHTGHIAWRQSRALHSELLQFPGRTVAAKLRLVDALAAERMAYWFAVPVRQLTKVTGYSEGQTHAFLMANCFGVLFDKATGIQVPKQPSTTRLTSDDWKTLIDWVRPWAKRTYGLDIEPPRHVLERNSQASPAEARP